MNRDDFPDVLQQPRGDVRCLLTVRCASTVLCTCCQLRRTLVVVAAPALDEECILCVPAFA